MTLDFAAKRYGVLPSQLLREGDTLDLHCANVAVAYEGYLREHPGVTTTHGFTTQQLQARLNETRGKT